VAALLGVAALALLLGALLRERPRTDGERRQPDTAEGVTAAVC
jgi:hypothetical protein